MVRDRPSGLKAAAHRSRDGPAGRPRPRRPLRPPRAASAGRPRACPTGARRFQTIQDPHIGSLLRFQGIARTSALSVLRTARLPAGVCSVPLPGSGHRLGPFGAIVGEGRVRVGGVVDVSRTLRWGAAGLVTAVVFGVVTWVTGAFLLPLVMKSAGDRWAVASGLGVAWLPWPPFGVIPGPAAASLRGRPLRPGGWFWCCRAGRPVGHRGRGCQRDRLHRRRHD